MRGGGGAVGAGMPALMPSLAVLNPEKALSRHQLCASASQPPDHKLNELLFLNLVTHDHSDTKQCLPVSLQPLSIQFADFQGRSLKDTFTSILDAFALVGISAPLAEFTARELTSLRISSFFLTIIVSRSKHVNADGSTDVNDVKPLGSIGTLL